MKKNRCNLNHFNVSGVFIMQILDFTATLLENLQSQRDVGRFYRGETTETQF